MFNFKPQTQESAAEARGQTGYADLPGPYLVEVLDTYDSKKVYPQDIEEGRSRFINMRLKIHQAIPDTFSQIPESTEEVEERNASQAGRTSSVRHYISPKNIEGAMQMLAAIAAGVEKGFELDDNEQPVYARVPEEFERKVVVASKGGEPSYDKDLMAKEAPINSGQLHGRLFAVYLENNGPRMKMNMFRSYGIPEAEQKEILGDKYQAPRNIFDGEDTASQDYLDKQSKRNDRGGKAEGGGNRTKAERSTGRTAAVGKADDDDFPDDDLPF